LKELGELERITVRVEEWKFARLNFRGGSGNGVMKSEL
jgi:hypothetical protein